MIKYIIEGGHPLHGHVQISGAKNAAVAIIPAALMVNGVVVLENLPRISDVDKLLTILERHNISIDYAPNGIDSVSVVMPTASIAPCLYTVLGEIQQELRPDRLEVSDKTAVIAAVGRRMAFTPGISGDPGLGWEGYYVAVLAENNPIAVLIIAIIFGGFRYGSISAQSKIGMPLDLLNIIKATMILCYAVRYIYPDAKIFNLFTPEKLALKRRVK